MAWQENIAADFGWVHDWQTLIGALLATAAAIATVVVMHGQTQEARKRDAAAMQRKALAARARMPNALRDLTDFCEAGAGKIIKGERKLPEEPSRALEDLKLAIEFIDTEQAEQLFELLSHYQVYTSRFPDYKNFVPAQGIYDSAKLHYYTARLYGYARNREDEGDGRSENELMISSMNTMVSLEERVNNADLFDAARKMIKTRHPE